jgi:4-carboxymuconolactone decarboxylase
MTYKIFAAATGGCSGQKRHVLHPMVERVVPRIPFPDLATMNPAQRAVHDAIVNGPRGLLAGPLRAALHNPELADKWQQFGALLRYRTSLAKRHSELAILVTARAWNCSFEWFQHEPHALAAGLPPALLDALRAGARPAFTDPADEAIYDYASQLQRDRTVTDEAHRAVKAIYGVTGTVELTALIGYYTLVAMTLNAHAFDLPAGADDPFGGPAAMPPEPAEIGPSIE